MTSGANLIAAERRRQIEGEGWSNEHDDEHDDESLAMAAACYALPTEASFVVYAREEIEDGQEIRSFHTFDPWPWWNEIEGPRGGWDREAAWDKRTEHDKRRRLVIAGALIAAELDRLQRVKQASPNDTDRKANG